MVKLIGDGRKKLKLDKLTITGFSVQSVSSVWWQQEFIPIVDHGWAVSTSNRTAIELKKGVVRKYWEWRGDKKQTDSPFLVSLQDSQAGDCGGIQQFPLWTEGGPSAQATEKKLN